MDTVFVITSYSIHYTKLYEDCTASPDAVINGTISGGNPPYTVTLVQGTGTPILSGNTFTLTTPISGNYQFQVTDASGCIALTDVVVLQRNNFV